MMYSYYAFGKIYNMRQSQYTLVGLKVIDIESGKVQSLSCEEFESICNEEYVADITYLKYRQADDCCLTNKKVFIKLDGDNAIFVLPSGKLEKKNAADCVYSKTSELKIANFDTLVEQFNSGRVEICSEAFRKRGSYVKIYSNSKFEVVNGHYSCYDFSEYQGGSILDISEDGGSVIVVGGNIRRVVGLPLSTLALVLLNDTVVMDAGQCDVIIVVQTGSKLATGLVELGYSVIERDLSKEFWKLSQRTINKVNMVAESDRKYKKLLNSIVYLNIQSEMKNLLKTKAAERKETEDEFIALASQFEPNGKLNELSVEINECGIMTGFNSSTSIVNFLLKGYLRYRGDVSEILLSFLESEDMRKDHTFDVVSAVGDLRIHRMVVSPTESMELIPFDIVMKGGKACSAYVSFITPDLSGIGMISEHGLYSGLYDLPSAEDNELPRLHNVKFKAGDSLNTGNVDGYNVIDGNITQFSVADVIIHYGCKRDLFTTMDIELDINLDTGQLLEVSGKTTVKRVYESPEDAELNRCAVSRSYIGCNELKILRELDEYDYSNSWETDIYVELKLLTTNGKFMLRIADKYKTPESLLKDERTALRKLGYIANDGHVNMEVLRNLIQLSHEMKNKRERVFQNAGMSKEEQNSERLRFVELSVVDGMVSCCGRDVAKVYEELYPGYVVNIFNGEIATYCIGDCKSGKILTGRYDSVANLREVYEHSILDEVAYTKTENVLTYYTDADLALALNFRKYNIALKSRPMVNYYRNLMFNNVIIARGSEEEIFGKFEFIKRFKERPED